MLFGHLKSPAAGLSGHALPRHVCGLKCLVIAISHLCTQQPAAPFVPTAVSALLGCDVTRAGCRGGREGGREREREGERERERETGCEIWGKKEKEGRGKEVKRERVGVHGPMPVPTGVPMCLPGL